MALVRRSADRYNLPEHRSLGTRGPRSSRPSAKTYNHYEVRNAVDSNNNNNSIENSAVDTASYRNSSKKNKSSIPIRQGSTSPPKLSSPNRQQEESDRRTLVSNHSLEAGQSEDSEETPKLKRKVKKRLERKPKRRNNANVWQDNAGRNGKKSYSSVPKDAVAHSSESEADELFDKNKNGVSAPRVSVTNHSPVVSVARPLKITYKPPTSTDEESTEQRRNRNERRKTLPITFTLRPPINQTATTEEAEDSNEDTLTSGGELSEGDEKRTSIRIVSSSAKSSDTEEFTKKLQIEAKSFKRSRKKDEEFISERGSRQTREDAIYTEKARNIINGNRRQYRTKEQAKLQRVQLQDAETTTDYARTLPRNFKTVRVPIQTQTNPEKGIEKVKQRRSSQPINFKRPTGFPGELNDQSSLAKSPSASSTKSNDLSATIHQCRRGCTHVVDDTVDGPRIIRRSRENRRKSNPNQILGRTEIQGLNKGRPKSGITRSSSLPRSSERPRVKSTAFEEFVEINDLSEFTRSKSRTLPYRKKRVTYHEGVKDDAYAFSESEAQDEEFQRHLLIHQTFTENAHKRLSSTTNQQIFDSERRDWTADSHETQGRAREIERKSRDYTENTSIGFQGLKEVRNQDRKVDTAQFFEAARQKRENYKQKSDCKEAEAKSLDLQEVRSQENNRQQFRQDKGERDTTNSASEEGHQVQYLQKNSQEKQRLEKKARKVVKEEIFEKKISERNLSEQKEEENRREGKIVTRSQTLPRKANREEYQDQKQQEFEEFIRNQRNLLLNQLYKREKGQEFKVKGESLIDQKIRNLEGKNTTKVQEDSCVEKKVETENSGRLIDEFLVFPNASKNKRRHKSTNDAQSIQEARFLHHNQQAKDQRPEAKVQRSQSSAVKSRRSEENFKEKPQFLLQNNQEPKAFEKNTDVKEDIVKVFSRGGIIRLTMESIDQERFEQRQREYEALQKRRSLHQQEQRAINDERYRYMNNEFDTKRNGFYYNEQRYDPGKRHIDTYYGNENFMWNDDVFEEQPDTRSTQITKVNQDQMQGQLDKVHYTICTHYFYPEDHELIVNLHRLGKIEVPRGLSHKDTCIFYNHLYVYEKEEVYAETLAPIMPTIKTEVVNLDEQVPEYETMSENSSANQSYNDDTSSQYSSSSRRERNLFSSLKAQKYYDAKQNNNNEDSVDFGFDSTYETLRRKRKSYNDDDDANRYGANSPGSSSGKSDFTYSKPRLLRRSEEFPGVGREVEDDYPRWTPKSPTARERDYGLSVALPP